MKKYYFFSIFTILLAMACQHAKAQNTDETGSPQIVVQADSVLWLDNLYTIKYQIDNCCDSLESYHLDVTDEGYNISYGPSLSTTTNYRYENTELTKQCSITLSYVLYFGKEGVFTLPILHAQTSSGIKLESKPFTVEVKRDSSNASSIIKAKDFDDENNVLALETTVNKNHIQLGDSVQYEIRLYTNMDVTSVNNFSIPIYPAYLNESELSVEDSYEATDYKGVTVNSYVLRKGYIIPLQKGKILIGPIEALFQIAKKNSDIDAFFNGRYSELTKDSLIKSKPITIQVDNKKLPQNTINFKNTTNTLGIVIDKSSSLCAMPDSISETYLQLENKLYDTLQKELESTSHSVTLFAKFPHYPSTSELKNLESVNPSDDNDGSAVYDAILAAALRDGTLTTEHSPYSILLLTDGKDNCSRVSEKTLINLLLQHNIRVDVITFASRKDSTYVFLKEPDGELIKIGNTQKYDDVERIAKATNGLFFLVENEEDIPDAIAMIKEKYMKNEMTKERPEKGFAPDNYILYKMYKEIWSDAESPF